jgi:hypothetical protein
MSEQFDSSEGEGKPKLYTGETEQDARFSELLDILKKQSTTPIKVKTTTKPSAPRGRQFTPEQERVFPELEASGDMEKAVRILFPNYCNLRNPVVKQGKKDSVKRSFGRWLAKKKKSFSEQTVVEL